MKVIFKTRDQAAQTLRDMALRRTGFVLRRMAWRVSQVSVQMTDINGPRHGVDKRCQVILVPTTGSQVVVTAEGRDWRVALNKALARAIEAFKKMFRRGQPELRAKRLDYSL